MAWRFAYCYKPRLSRRHQAEYVSLDPELLSRCSEAVEASSGTSRAQGRDPCPIIYCAVVADTKICAPRTGIPKRCLNSKAKEFTTARPSWKRSSVNERMWQLSAVAIPRDK